MKTQINFCEQSISRDTKIIKCNKQVLQSDFQKLKYFKELRFIDLNNSSFHDICLLNNLENLETISLKNTEINNLKCLNNIKNISYLNLQNTKIENFKNILNKNLLIIELNKINKTEIKLLSHKTIKPIIIILKNMRVKSHILYKISKNKYSILPSSITNKREVRLANALIKHYDLELNKLNSNNQTMFDRVKGKVNLKILNLLKKHGSKRACEILKTKCKDIKIDKNGDKIPKSENNVGANSHICPLFERYEQRFVRIGFFLS